MRTLGRDCQHDRRLTEPEPSPQLGRRQWLVWRGYARPERCDVDAAGFNTEELDNVLLRGLRVGQQHARAACGQRHEQRDAHGQAARGFREALVDHVMDRRYLRQSGERRRRVERVVQNVDSGTPCGVRQERLLCKHTSRAAPRANWHTDNHRLVGPGLGEERRKRLVGGKERHVQVLPGQQRRHEPADVRLPAPGFAGNEVKDVEPDVQGLPPVNVVERLERALERQPLPIATEPRSRRAPQLRPRRVHSEDGVGELLRLG